MSNEPESTVSESAGEANSLSVRLPAKYAIKSLIGQGGMSRVYLAIDQQMNREVAVKIMKLGDSADSKNEHRFQQEIKVLASIDHPNIVKIYSSGVTENGDFFLVMEYLKGTTLADELAASGKLSAARFKEVFLPVTDALEYLHGQKFVHRDLKPSNIMTCNDPELGQLIKIIDFGLVKVLTDQGSASLTRTNVAIGSPAYMSPEQCKGEKANEATDVYSLACIMYETLTGSKPFSAETDLELMHKHMYEKPPSLKFQTRGSAEIGLETLIHTSMEKDRALRPDSASLKSKLNSIFAKGEPDTRLFQKTASSSKNTTMIVAGLVLLGLVSWALISGVTGGINKKVTPTEVDRRDSGSTLRKKTNARNVNQRIRNIYRALEMALAPYTSASGISTPPSNDDTIKQSLKDLDEIARNNKLPPKSRLLAAMVETNLLRALLAPLDAQLEANKFAVQLSRIDNKDTKETAQCTLNLAETYLVAYDDRTPSTDKTNAKAALALAHRAREIWNRKDVSYTFDKETRTDLLQQSTHVEGRTANAIGQASLLLGSKVNAKKYWKEGQRITMELNEWLGAAHRVTLNSRLYLHEKMNSEAKNELVEFHSILNHASPTNHLDQYIQAYAMLGDFCKEHFPELEAQIREDGHKKDELLKK